MRSLAALLSAPGPFPGAVRLEIPAVIDCVVGCPYRIDWLSVMLTPTLDGYTFEVQGPGSVSSSAWTFTPGVGDIGSKNITISVFQGGVLVARRRALLVVRSEFVPNGTTLKVVLCGDSITATDVPYSIPDRVYSRFTAAGGNVTLLGTQHGASQGPNAFHEGYSGRTYQWFAHDFVDGGTQTPFYTVGGASRISTWVSSDLSGIAPDLMHFQLGPNDANAYGGAPEGMDAYFLEVMESAEKLITDIRAVLPNVYLSFGAVFGCNIQDSSFGTPGTVERLAYRTKRQRFLEIMTTQFSNRTSQKIHFFATSGVIDTTDGFPNGNSVHPDESGLGEAGDAIYAGIRRVTG